MDHRGANGIEKKPDQNGVFAELSDADRDRIVKWASFIVEMLSDLPRVRRIRYYEKIT